MPANRINWPLPAAIGTCLALGLAFSNAGCQGKQPGNQNASQQMQQRFDQSETRANKDIQTQQRRLGAGQSALQKGR